MKSTYYVLFIIRKGNVGRKNKTMMVSFRKVGWSNAFVTQYAIYNIQDGGRNNGGGGGGQKLTSTYADY